MRRKDGDHVTNFSLPAIDGSTLSLESLKGRRFLLSFYRFASCPFCNLRVHELTKRFGEFGGNFTIVAVFDSSLENLRRHAEKHQAPFPILADAENTCYKAYGIEHSLAGMMKGMFGRMPTLLKSMFLQGNIPWVIEGSMTTMPADFLVDEKGVIQTAHYGRDEGDHLPFELVKTFAVGQEKKTVLQ